MRHYDVGIATLAIDAPRKWTDNLLSQHSVADVAHRRRGVARAVSWQALVRIAIIRELHQMLGCGVREAVALAARFLELPAGDPLRLGALSIALDRGALERQLHARLRDALESAPRPRRGRPPVRGRRSGGSDLGAPV